MMFATILNEGHCAICRCPQSGPTTHRSLHQQGLLVDVKPLYGRSTWAILLPINCENEVLPGEQESEGKLAGKQTRFPMEKRIRAHKKFFHCAIEISLGRKTLPQEILHCVATILIKSKALAL
ncbi:MAG: hypothetical protein Q7T64_05915 [Lacisediminimonas sp.]|nr:hypothetical protein [Lacisediminimonas sp.]